MLHCRPLATEARSLLVAICSQLLTSSAAAAAPAAPGGTARARDSTTARQRRMLTASAQGNISQLIVVTLITSCSAQCGGSLALKVYLLDGRRTT